MEPNKLQFFILIILFYILNVESFGIERSSRDRYYHCASLEICDCFGGKDYEISCPNRINTDIILRVEPQRLTNRVEIECFTLDRNVYKQFPDWNVGESNIVKLKSCPIAPDHSIHEILYRIGIRNVHTLLVSMPSNVNEEQKYLPENAFDNMEHVSSLHFRSNGWNVSFNSFKNLDNLELLQLSFNNITQNIFYNQKNLKRLNLLANKLPKLSKEMFADANSITHLDLSSNKIDNIESNAFEYLFNITEININGNEFAEIPKNIFTNNQALRVIYIVNNQLKNEILPNGLLSNLPELQELAISGNDFHHLPDDLIQYSSNVQNISLTHNALIDIPATIFNTQINLINLDLSYNNLTTLDDFLFNTTIHLKVLRLSHNRLSKITSILTSGLNALQELYLDNNNLYSIHMAAFDGTDLRIINLQNNHLEFSNIEGKDVNIDKISPFQNLNNLKVLNMRNNSMKHFLTDWNMMNLNLEELDLSYNQIRMINFGFILNIWHKPITINLSNNQIVTMIARKRYETNNQLQSTWILNNNPLKCDCLIIHFVNYIQNKFNEMTNGPMKLVTDDLKCASPNQFIGKSPKNIVLEHLICPLDGDNLSDKKCPNECKCWVRTIDKTAIFNCSNANLTKIPQLPDIKSLGLEFYELHIENNNISTLPIVNTTTGYQYVNRLFAKNNSIDKLLVEHVPNNLISLDLSNNKMQEISSSVLLKLTHLSTLQNISFEQNPWSCDCGAYNLLQFIRTHSTKIVAVNDITCNNDNSTSLIKVESLCPIEKTTIICIIIGVFIVLILLSTTLYYKYQQEIMVWLYAHYAFLWFLNKNVHTTDDGKKYDAFILYSMMDEEFVADNLIPELENGAKPLKLCLLTRDSKVGEFIPNSISQCVENSRRTIVVLTPNFIDSFTKVNNYSETKQELDIWGLMGFRFAHKNALDDRRSRVIIITHGDIGCVRNFDSELKAYLKTNIYLRWNEPMFFNKLRLAIAYPKYFKRKCQSSRREHV